MYIASPNKSMVVAIGLMNAMKYSNGFASPNWKSVKYAYIVLAQNKTTSRMKNPNLVDILERR